MRFHRFCSVVVLSFLIWQPPTFASQTFKTLVPNFIQAVQSIGRSFFAKEPEPEEPVLLISPAPLSDYLNQSRFIEQSA